jgi:hypothetical protein
MEERREIPYARARHASPLLAEAGRRVRARGIYVNGLPKSGPRFVGARVPFAVFIFGDLGFKSARYGNLNPKPIRFRLLTRREVGLASLSLSPSIYIYDY